MIYNCCEGIINQKYESICAIITAVYEKWFQAHNKVWFNPALFEVNLCNSFN